MAVSLLAFIVFRLLTGFIVTRQPAVDNSSAAAPLHVLVEDVQLDPSLPMSSPDPRLERAMHDVSSQTARRIVFHLIVDEAAFSRWQADDTHSHAADPDAGTDEAGSEALHSAELLQGESEQERHTVWSAAVGAFQRQSSLYRAAMERMLPWLERHRHHIVVLPYSWSRVLALPWPDSAHTVGHRLELLCADLALADCATTPTGLYLIKTLLAAVLPQWADHVIVLDSDVRVHGDIADILQFLHTMRSQPTASPTVASSAAASDTTSSLSRFFVSAWSAPVLSSLFPVPLLRPVMALAAEQQTFYDLRHPALMRRRLGFNGGVQLQDLVELRRTEPGSAGREYSDRLLTSNIAGQFTMGLLLGDQTVYTALNNSAPHLFLGLPCHWNRQLCEYYFEPWRKRDVEARRCPGQWRIVHGNCAQERDTPDELGDQWRSFHKQQQTDTDTEAEHDSSAEREAEGEEADHRDEDERHGEEQQLSASGQ